MNCRVQAKVFSLLAATLAAIVVPAFAEIPMGATLRILSIHALFRADHEIRRSR